MRDESVVTHAVPVTGVIGLGSVGSVLVRMLRDSGHEVIGVDSDPAVLTRLARLLDATPIRDAAARHTATVTLTDDPAALNRAGLVIEAVPEDQAVKAAVLQRLHTICAEESVVVTTTSSLPLVPLAVASGRPCRFMALRFFTPPDPAGPAEPVRTTMTSDDSVVAVQALVSRLGLKMVATDARHATDATALVYAYLNRAMTLYERDGASRDAIDTAMRLGCGLPAGPLELLDRIGLDSALAVLIELWTRTGDPAFSPPAVLNRNVALGRLGHKRGRGFYEYDDAGNKTDAASPAPDSAEASKVRRIAVLGSGTMAQGIAESSAAASFGTLLVARSEDKASRALARIEESLTRSVRRGRSTTAAKAEALDLLVGTADLDAVADCDLVIEAVVEDPEVKHDLFSRLGATCKPCAILATTTSSLSVAACAEASGRPTQVVGMHFFNPASVMRLVELVRTDTVGDEAVATARAVCARMGKTAVHCRDRTGFIANYLLFPYLGRALSLLDRYDVRVEGIDTAIVQGYGYPMGPFALLDRIGLDVSLAIQRALYEEFKESDFAPSTLLEQLVTAGWLGHKNKRGLQCAG